MRTPTVLGVLLAGGIALAGCTPSQGPSDQPPAPGTPPPQSAIAPAAEGGPKAPNQVDPKSVDREFAQQLLSHHQVATQLIDLAKSGSHEDEVKEFAEQVEKAEGPVVDQAGGWLRAQQGQEAVRNAADPAVGTTTWMPPANPKAVPQLQETSGEEFEKAFADAMYDHLDKVTEMGRAELAHGTDPQMRALAQQVVDSREQLRDKAEELGRSV